MTHTSATLHTDEHTSGDIAVWTSERRAAVGLHREGAEREPTRGSHPLTNLSAVLGPLVPSVCSHATVYRYSLQPVDVDLPSRRTREHLSRRGASARFDPNLHRPVVHPWGTELTDVTNLIIEVEQGQTNPYKGAVY